MPQRSPLILVLLAAATLAVDAVAISWLMRAGVDSAASYLYDALISAQLALVCLWSVFAARHTIAGWIATIVAALVATQPSMRLTGQSFSEEFGTYAIYVSMLVVALWILKRTSLWHRITGSEAAVWQYSTGVLLTVMTAVAVLIVLLRTSGVLTDAIETWRLIAMLTAGDVLMVLATTVIWALDYNLLLRLAAVGGVASLIGLTEISCGISGAMGTDLTNVLKQEWPGQFGAYTIMMSLLVFVWLELAPIIPISRHAKSAATDAKE